MKMFLKQSILKIKVKYASGLIMTNQCKIYAFLFVKQRLINDIYILDVVKGIKI